MAAASPVCREMRRREGHRCRREGQRNRGWCLPTSRTDCVLHARESTRIENRSSSMLHCNGSQPARRRSTLPSLRRYEPVQVPRVLLSIDKDAPRAGRQCRWGSYRGRGTYGDHPILMLESKHRGKLASMADICTTTARQRMSITAGWASSSKSLSPSGSRPARESLCVPRQSFSIAR